MLSTGNNLLWRNRQPITSVLKKAAVSTTCVDNINKTLRQNDIQHVTVLGGGVMGAGIAQASAQSGHNVTVVDTDEYTQKCMVSIMKSLNILSQKKFPNEPMSAKKFIDDIIGNIQTTQSMTKGCENADLVIESVVESLKIKKMLLKRADEVAPSGTIFASNTSSLLIKDIAAGTAGRLDRFAGLHFFNPVWKMKLVEVIGIDETSEDTLKQVTSYIGDIGKVPVRCKDNSGFIVNNLLYPYLLDAVRFYERGEGTIEDIDTAMKLGAGLPSGPFELIDIIGLDTVYYVCNLWHEQYPDDPKFVPIKTLTKMVEQKKLGRKTGQGFYKYAHKLY